MGTARNQTRKGERASPCQAREHYAERKRGATHKSAPTSTRDGETLVPGPKGAAWAY